MSQASLPSLRVEVAMRPGRFDAEAARLHDEIAYLFRAAVEVRTLHGYSLGFAAPPEAARLERVLPRVLVDPVLQEARVLASDAPVPEPPAGWSRIDVVRRPGVMDPAAASVLRAFAAVGVPLHAARTYRSVLLRGDLSPDVLEAIGRQLLGNPRIEEIRVAPREPIRPVAEAPARDFPRRDVPLRELGDPELVALSRNGLLALNLEEMQAIQQHFRAAGRDPTDVELETLAQTWSEHCKHKTLTATVELPDRRYGNLLGETIFRATEQLARPYCLSVFRDNAGVVEFDDEYAVTFKVETHNHPSALEPYGGAGTGIGGVLRDTLGTGLGAQPFLSTDVFCVGPLDLREDALPPGTLPPRRILQGIVAGVRDYGNRMGIPTPSGAILVHPGYRANPLVFCGSVGLLPRTRLEKRARPGDHVYVLGGRTGRDGIHGATFSSEGLDSASEEVAGGAVQIGNPIEEKRLMDACLDARDRGLFTAVTDCGAGGLSSAVGEMGADCGAEVELAHVPLKYAGLSPGEIWISEAQERMVVAVPPEHAAELEEVCRIHQVEATDLGRFTASGRLRITFRGEEVLDLPMEFLHHGVPRPLRKATPPPPRSAPLVLPSGADLAATLLALLRHPDVTSKEEVCRQYDHEVLSGSALKPLVGPGGFGPSDACVGAPRLGSRKGVVVGCGLNPLLGNLDPYQMALSAVDEAVRNVVCAGGRFDRIVLLDNFAWPSAQDEESLGALVLAAEACRDAALAFETPFISGKDSLNNELRTEAGTLRIPPTLLISALSLIEDVTRAVSMDLKAAGHAVYLVGTTGGEVAGARFLDLCGARGGSVPRVDLPRARQVHERVAAAVGRGLARSCHDLSEGGLGVAAAEMALAGGVGMTLELARVPRPEGLEKELVLLFSESPTRYLLEVEPRHGTALEELLGDVPWARIGSTETGARLRVTGVQGGPCVDLPLAELTHAFRTGLGI